MVERENAHTLEGPVASRKEFAGSRLRKPDDRFLSASTISEALVFFLTGLPESKVAWALRELAGVSFNQGMLCWERERTTSKNGVLQLKERERALLSRGNKLRAQLGKERGSLDAFCAASKALGKIAKSKPPQPEREVRVVAEVAQMAARILTDNTDRASLREVHLRGVHEFQPLERDLFSEGKLEKAVAAVLQSYSNGAVTVDDILRPCGLCQADPRLLLALGVRGTGLGTKDAAVRTKNMCGIGAKGRTFESFEEGNLAVLRALERSGYLHPFCTAPAFAANGSRFASGSFVSILRNVSKLMHEA